MKKILKKIGLIGIIIGVLSPFITLPKVNAVNDCDYYLNQYLFLDVSLPSGFVDYSDDDGYTTYTSFHFNFPKITADQVLTIESVEEFKLSTLNKLGTYHDQIKLLEQASNKSIKNIEKEGEWTEQTFNSGDYDSITSFLHGKWGYEGQQIDPAGWEIDYNVNNFPNVTLQGVLINNNALDDVELEMSFGGAVYNTKKETFSGTGRYSVDLVEHLQKIVDDFNSGSDDSLNNGYIYKTNDSTYLNFSVNRQIALSDLNQLNYGIINQNKYYVWSTTNDKSNIKNSYTAYSNYIDNESKHELETDPNKCKSSGTTCYLVEVDNANEIHFQTNESYFWPAILDVEYKVCNKEASNIPGKSWTLTYNSSVTDNSVTKMPEKQTGITTNSVTLSSTKPERKDYIFKSWCTEKDGKGTCVEAGKTFENKDMTDKTVYAYWVKPGTANNEKQGVMSYVVGFAAIGLITYGLYYAINKKNLFKQI